MKTAFDFFKKPFSIYLLVMALSFAGCGRKENNDHSKEEKEHSKTETHKEDDGHGHGGHGDEGGAGASYSEGKGLQLTPETSQSMGVKTAEVIEQSVRRQVNVRAQIYRTASESFSGTSYEKPGFAYASAIISPSDGNSFKKGQTVEIKLEEHRFNARVSKIDRTMESFSKQAEVLIEIDDPSKTLSQGAFVEATLNGSLNKTLAVPRPAILSSALGNFVYVVNGDFLFRTEVKIGAEGNEFVEIKEGVYEGDTVVEQPVQKLWLIELRFTKGGGHSH